jgi:hypothetical protein
MENSAIVTHQATVTAYCLKGHKSYTGSRRLWGVAVNRHQKHLIGKWILIPGYGKAPINDLMGAGHPKWKFDARMPYNRAIKWGVRKVKVTIFRKAVKQ